MQLTSIYCLSFQANLKAVEAAASERAAEVEAARSAIDEWQDAYAKLKQQLEQAQVLLSWILRPLTRRLACVTIQAFSLKCLKVLQRVRRLHCSCKRMKFV